MRGESRGCEGLLDYLASRSGCAYLSDLRVPATAGELEQAVEGAPIGCWPVEAWREAVSYIAGDGAGAENESEARAALIAWCKRHSDCHREW